jgi:hypothetical protein
LHSACMEHILRKSTDVENLLWLSTTLGVSTYRCYVYDNNVPAVSEEGGLVDVFDKDRVLVRGQHGRAKQAPLVILYDDALVCHSNSIHCLVQFKERKSVSTAVYSSGMLCIQRTGLHTALCLHHHTSVGQSSALSKNMTLALNASVKIHQQQYNTVKCYIV